MAKAEVPVKCPYCDYEQLLDFRNIAGESRVPKCLDCGGFFGVITDVTVKANTYELIGESHNAEIKLASASRRTGGTKVGIT